jgi:adenylate cyclase
MTFWKLKLRSLLLLVFLFTMILSSALIIGSSYEKYSSFIKKFSLSTIDRTGYRIYERVACLVKEIEDVPFVGELLYESNPNIDVHNARLISSYLLTLKEHPSLFGLYIGFPNGTYLMALDITFSESTPQSVNAPTPKGANYAVTLVNRETAKPIEFQAFYNQDLELLSVHEIDSKFDPRNRPWYEGAEKVKGLYWTDLYKFYFVDIVNGISVAVPFYDASGRLLSIVGADLTFNLFEKFLSQQTISKNGKAFVLDDKGDILLPSGPFDDAEKKVVSHALAAFKKNQADNFSFDIDGDTYLASVHEFATSYDKHWNILTVAPLSDFFHEFLVARRNAVILSLIVLAIASLFIVILSFNISKPIVKIANEIDRIARLELDSEERVSSHITEIRLIDDSVAHMRNALRSFAHYVPKRLAIQLMHKSHTIALGGEKKTLSIFFTDIENFTAIAETLPIEKLSPLLTEYFEILTKIILDCGGTIDKFIGDSIMSIWGAPDDLPDFAAKACTAALLGQQGLKVLHAKWKKEGLPIFETRMGIKTGTVIVGNFGTTERMNYSVIGDTVNTASRLQALNKTYHTEIIIGEETKVNAGPQFVTRFLDVVEIRGKKGTARVYELLAKTGGEREIAPKPGLVEFCAAFSKAVETLEKGKSAEAKKQFKALHEEYPDDFPTQLYLERLSKK